MTVTEPTFSFGIEEEYHLVDLATRDLAAIPPALMERCEARLGARVAPEFLVSQIEIGTRPVRGLADARAELGELRRTVIDEARAFGLAPIAAATHPFALARNVETTPKERYRTLARDLAGAAGRMTICGMHVHVGIEDDDLRIDLMNQARYFLPHLLVLSTSSPFFEGADTGLKSYRVAINHEMPRSGLPGYFETWALYRQTIDVLVKAGAIEDATKIWWDLRPSARFPTLEMRITDVCPLAADALAVAALYVAILRMLYRLRRANLSWRRYPVFLLEENRWRAQRYGVEGSLFDFGKGELVAFRDLVEELIALLREDAEAFGCLSEMEHARVIVARGTSADRQVARFTELQAQGLSREQALAGVVDHLIAEGLADPERLGVMGGSYGGFMTAWVTTRTGRFKAAQASSAGAAWATELAKAMGGTATEDIEWGGGELAVNKIIDGRILRVDEEFVLVDVGYKSEGIIPRNEWEEHEPPPEPGQSVKVLVEEVEDVFGRTEESRGMITLSKRKAEKIEAWLKVMETVHEGDIVTGTVTRKIKGGLLVDIGVNVFLPASQVDIRRPADIGDYIGRAIQCIVLKIDDARRNIVVSRRKLIEDRRKIQKEKLLAEIEPGQVRKGVVKNIADFGAFVDLGGIDGLLHITDMSWGRINHPSEMVQIDDQIEVMILHIDYEKEKIALGLPCRISNGRAVDDPVNLGPGWVSYNFTSALGKPVRLVNDACLQALGSYDGGRMLFLGLGTAVGSALVADRLVLSLDMGRIRYGDDRVFEVLGDAGFESLGVKKWSKAVHDIVPALKHAVMADYVVLGGGNVKELEELPDHVRRGGDAGCPP